MRSKTSCFNKTIFKKDLTRFAPVWGMYTLCLVVGILLIYTNGGTAKQFHFARNMLQLVEIMAVVNLFYAPVVAQLLFGDLYNSRFCNMLHAFPLTRESWFFTHVLSGIAFSVIPTAVMALVSLPLLTNSIFENAVSISGWIFLASNLQFILFFGLAVFAAMCVGNRFTMLAGYGLLNGGALLAYWLIDTVYTPMLYGVLTPTRLMNQLSPLYYFTNFTYLETDASLYQLREVFGNTLAGATASFTVTEHWWQMWMLAGVGLVFAGLGLVLYRKRDLECAGDAVAFPVLVPVFQVLCAVCFATAGQMMVYILTDLEEQNLLVLCTGLVVGWFIGNMLTQRTTRVLKRKTFRGVALLAAAFALSLLLTHVDILGIETRLPRLSKIQSVTFDGQDYTDPEDIENFLLMNQDALENRAEHWGSYVLVDGQWVYYIDTNADKIQEGDPNNRYTRVEAVTLTYELKNGRQIRRRYNIWMDSSEVSSLAGRIAKEYLTRWDTVAGQTTTVDGVTYNRLEMVMEDVRRIYVDYMAEESPITPEQAKALIAAIQKDCQEGNMAQSYYYHEGYFRIPYPESERKYIDTPSISLDLSGWQCNWWVSVYADSRHTVKWLTENGFLDAEIMPGIIP